ncbi:MAG: Na(+)-translocating NADH-quinone reductase subunit A [Dysgonamonadaceae bacterium]|jgi:Na+-transporting NADH:ubiquinone oxidoreductase subunit A|nr:Na(+)-translocating NADH-quinone reductase subunit A [Dysgonamonadaceae bacterium]
MGKIVKIKRGLDINLKGKASNRILGNLRPDSYSIIPDDFIGITPKVAVKVDDKIKAGTVILHDKNHPEIKIVAPVSGKITAINRGEKRKLLSIDILADTEIQYIDFGKSDIPKLSIAEIKEKLSAGGMLPFIKQRPYDIIANPQDTPRDIFVTGFNTAPLAPETEIVLKGQKQDFQTGLDILSELTSGKVYLSIKSDCDVSCLKEAKNAEVITFEGPHPAGNIGIQINHIKPVNKGEIVWTVNYADIPFIGRLFNKGIADFTRLVALTGSEITETGYYQTIIGANLSSIFQGKTTTGKELRYISGNVLTGKRIPENGYLGFYDNQITVIPEGKETNEFLGWIAPGFNKFSVSHTYFAWLLNAFRRKEYTIDARIKGGKRAMIMSNEYDKVFPMDIYPEYLLKAIIAFNIDKMESLGIYEVAPEDFALCEFVDTSKIEIQSIVRKGVDLLYKEMNG